MRAADMVRKAIVKMERCGVPEAEMSARLLMDHVIGKTYAARDAMTSEQIERFSDLIEERVRDRTPVQYLLGEWDFYNLTGLKMKSPVLIPRPETEQLVDFAVEIVGKNKNSLSILDPCAGSGAIGLALLRHFPNATCFACDVNKDAVDLARHNASLMGLSSRYECVESCVSKLVEKSDEFDLLVCNPPYISSDMSSRTGSLSSLGSRSSRWRYYGMMSFDLFCCKTNLTSWSADFPRTRLETP